LVAIRRDGAGKTIDGTFFESVEKIGLVKPNEVNLTTAVFKGGDLEILVGFGVNIFDKGKLAADGDVLVFFYLGNRDKVTKVNVSPGKMIEEMVGSIDVQFLQFLQGFGSDAGDVLEVFHRQSMLSLSSEIENKKKDIEESNFNSNFGGVGFVRDGTVFERFVKIKAVAKLLFWLENMKRQWRKLDKKRLKMMIWRVLPIILVLGVVGTVGIFAWYSRDLPSPTSVVRREGYATRIYDRDGELLYDVYKDAKRTPVEWEDLPDYLKQATIAIEDKDFYEHKGFDPLAPFRIAKNVLTRGRLIGGSTLTQQLVKNVLLTSERSVNRKIKEFILSVQIEAKYDKDEILLMYLNESPYGGAAWGVGSGAEMIFAKSVAELNLAESVILAGLPQRPNAYSPFAGDGYIGRSEDVLRRMVEDGTVSQDLADQTMEQVKNYEFSDNKTTMGAPHFVFWVKSILADHYGEDVVEGGGLKVTTTLDSELQEKMAEVVADEIEKAESKGISNGAAIVIDPRDGQVLAMTGSRDYFSDKTDGKFNVVTQGLRQPGSAIKPVTYLTAIRKGWTAASLMMDVETHFPGGAGQKDYVPQNYNGQFSGPMLLRNALGNSINVTAVKMLASVGVKNMLTQAYSMGLSTLEPTTENMRRFGLAVTLGGAEVTMADLAAAYGSFANGGKKVDLVGVLKVEDREGRVLEEFKAVEGKAVMSPQEAFIISHILSDNSARRLTFGEVNGLIISNHQVAVKTGTTNDKRDNWCIGWTPNLLTAVWVGNNDNSPMKRVASGVSGATPIWRRIMQFGVSQRNKQDFPIPDKIVSLEVDGLSGWSAHDGFESRQEYFIDGTQPAGEDPVHLKLKVCRGADGLAPPEDVSSGNYDEREYIRLVEDDPISGDGQNRWQEAIDAWVAGQEDKDKYYPPEDYCREGGRLTMDFSSPGDQSTTSNDIEVKISTASLVKVVEAKLWVNGEEKKRWEERPFEIILRLDDGKYTLKAWAKDKNGNEVEREIKIGVNMAWDWQPSPTPTITPEPTVTPSVTPTTVLSPTETMTPSLSPTI